MTNDERGTCVHSYMGQRPRLGVLAKRVYRVLRGRLERDPRDARVIVEPEYKTVDGEHLLTHDSDLFAFQKPLTDVVLNGSAHAVRGESREVDTGLAVGRVSRRVRVTGVRLLRVRSDGTMFATRPEPFKSIPLSWALAYGGRDETAERILVPDREHRMTQRRLPNDEDRLAMGTFAYPRNRVGRGFRIDVDRRRLDGTLLPTQSDPEDAFTVERMLARGPSDWIDRPVAAGYGPIDGLTFPRCVHMGVVPISQPSERPVRELALGGMLLADFQRQPFSPRDPRAYNCAPPGLAVARLKGGERVRLWNLHRGHELLEFDLPGERPRLIIEPPGTRAFELEALLGSVLIEPDEDRVTTVWTGAMDVASVYPSAQCEEIRHAAIWS